MADELKKLAPILDALESVAHNPDAYRKTLNEIDQLFASALHKAATEQRVLDATRLSQVDRFKQSIVRALHQPKSHEELVASIKRTCDLSERQTRLLTDIRLLSSDVYGQPVLRPKEEVILPPAKAAVYLFLIGVLTGFAISSILVEPDAGIRTVIRGFGLGLAIGSIAGFVLGRSFRAYPLIEKLELLYPWLNASRVKVGTG